MEKQTYHFFSEHVVYGTSRSLNVVKKFFDRILASHCSQLDFITLCFRINLRVLCTLLTTLTSNFFKSYCMITNTVWSSFQLFDRDIERNRYAASKQSIYYIRYSIHL